MKTALLSYLSFFLLCISNLNGLTLTKGPEDIDLERGDSTVLQCLLAYAPGSFVQVQWAKDGILLGFDPDIPGYPRYTMVGDTTKGEFHLKIDDVQLSDDAKFECQAMVSALSQPIRATAKLTVLVPPKEVKLDTVTNGVLELIEGREHRVTCTSFEAKPAAEITWFKNGEKIKEGVEMKEQVENKLVSTSATLQLEANAIDNGAVFTCGAKHITLPSYIYANFSLAVLYPPGKPLISGYGEGELRAGQRIKLECEVPNGNPYPHVYWYKNEKEIDKSFHNQPTVTRNDYEFIVDASDNEAEYRCEAHNQVDKNPVASHVKLKVYFAPDDVTILGPTEARLGSSIMLQCDTAMSHPPATVQWVVAGNLITNAPQRVRQVNTKNKSGAITISNITVTLDETSKHGLDVTCKAWNAQLFGREGSRVDKTIRIKVQYPPESVKIYARSEGPLLSGVTQTLTCTAKGGNPLPTLHWFKGSTRRGKAKWRFRELKQGTKSIVKSDHVENELEILVKPSDNGARYRCEAITPALDQPIREVTNLSVYFPPEEVTIRSNPEILRSGKLGNLICESSASNPAPNIYWMREGSTYKGINVQNKSGIYGGFEVTNKLHIRVTANDDQANYVCKAERPEWNGKGAAIAYKLNVLYPPRFTVDSPQMAAVLENESLSLNLSALGKPGDVKYTWFKNDVPLTQDTLVSGIFVSGPIINISSVSRSHHAEYKIKAENSEGESVLLLKLSVKYAAVITKLTNAVIAKEGESVTLECYADAHPMIENMVKWIKYDEDLSYGVQRYSEGQSSLYIPSIANHMTGVYTCVAFNGFGEETKANAQLLVKQPPIIDRSSKWHRFAAEKMGTAKLVCRASGVPSVSISWRKGTNPKLLKHSGRYSLVHRKVGLITQESELRITDVSESDYGRYECVAINELGETTKIVTLDRVGAPDPPQGIDVANITHDSVTIQWEPGFDGGKPQSFSIRYSEVGGSKDQQVINVYPKNATGYTVIGLEPRTQYMFTVASQNEMGFSGYPAIENIIRTAGSEASIEMGSEAIPLVVIVLIVLVGVVLLLLNAFIVFCFIRRHKKRKLQAGMRAKRVTIQSPMSSPVPEKAANARLEPRAGVQMYSDNGGVVGLRPDTAYSSQEVHSTRPTSDLSDDNHSMNTVIEIDEYGNPIAIQRVSPNTYQTYLIDDPSEKLITAPIDYNAYDWIGRKDSGSRDPPPLPSYTDTLRSNSLHNRFATGHYASLGYPEPPTDPQGAQDIPPPMGPLRTLSQELSHYAPYQYATNNNHNRNRRYSPPQDGSGSPLLSATAPGAPRLVNSHPVNGYNSGSLPHRTLVTTSTPMVGSSPILSTFTPGAPLVKQDSYLDSEHGDLV